ncbi:hypothetical protein Plec18170_004479 [Paecilomyces lecythidis]
MNHGAVGLSYLYARAFQGMSLIAIIGMTANFIAEMVNSNVKPPNVLIGTLSVTCIAVLYCFLTVILFMDKILPFLIFAGVDLLVLIAVIVVAVTVGKPLSYLDCKVIGKLTGSNSSAYAFATTLGSLLDKEGGTVKYTDWIGASKSICLEMKSIWGLSIALCILFAYTVICSIIMWRQNKAPAEEKP